MFTGLVEEVGRVRSVSRAVDNRRLEVEAELAAGLAVGDSLAVNGCCLTVTGTGPGRCLLEATAATVKTTTLDTLRAGSRINLERALAAGDRFGGHFVQGHVDEVARVRRVERRAGYHEVHIRCGRSNRHLLVSRGSVCLDGVSLTIAALSGADFSVNVIPHTRENTVLKDYRAGTAVNVEYDLMVKAAARRLETQRGEGNGI
ncbi:MAG TPA: riboflavin synthase [candidate division WOR-3 bacterium]|uniref:Riboflavin synthase n=1 Tax=candidate division WOR-3 bacterium TaxID=2052148 RepID=A0A7V0XF12_UNCW3|nr:riboflavin synthase [candidate division WOR-3 bacterium]